MDNPDLRDRGFIYWRLLSTDPAAATDIVFSEKPPISTESEAMDRGVLDRLLLHTGTLASLYGKEPQTFIRGSRSKFLQDSPALDPSAKQSYLDSLQLPAHRPVPTRNTSSRGAADLLAPPPAVPPKPLIDRSNSLDYRREASDGLLGIEGDGESEDEDAALNPSAAVAAATFAALASPDEADVPMDPYASLARLSTDGGFGGGGGLSPGGADYYGSSTPELRSANGIDHSLL